MSNDIGGFFSGAIQSIEQNVESGVENMFSGKSGTSTAGGAQGSNSLGGFDIGALFGSGNNGIGALFGSGSNGLFGELFAKLGGSELGIIGNLFQGNTNKTQQGNGYAPPPSSCGTYIPPPPPGNTGTAGTGTAVPAGTSGSGWGPGSIMDNAISSLETLMMNFSKCSSNGQMTPASLQQAAWDPSNPSLQQAAKFFTDNPSLMRDLFIKGGGSSASFDQLNSLDSMWTQMQKSVTGAGTGTATTANLNVGTGATTTTGTGLTGTGDASTIAQLQQQIAQLEQQLNAYGANGTGGTGGTGAINPNLTTGGVGLTGDAKTSGYGTAITSLQNQISALETDAQNNPANAQIDAAKISTLNNEVQMLMQMQQQDFQMMSEIMKDFHDMSMTAIRNING